MSESNHSSKIRSVLRQAIVIGVIGMSACWMTACFKGPEDNDFKELIGVWKTDSPKYADCTFEISDALIVFTNGPSHISVNFIQNVEKSRQPGKTFFRIHYKDSQDLSYQLDVVYFVDEDGEKIQYKNQNRLIWTKMRSSSTPPVPSTSKGGG